LAVAPERGATANPGRTSRPVLCDRGEGQDQGRWRFV